MPKKFRPAGDYGLLKASTLKVKYSPSLGWYHKYKICSISQPFNGKSMTTVTWFVSWSFIRRVWWVQTVVHIRVFYVDGTTSRAAIETQRLHFYAAICCCEVTKFCISLVKFVTTNMVTNLIPVQHLMSLKYIMSYLHLAFSWRVDSAKLYPGTGTHIVSLSLTNTHIHSNFVDSLWALLFSLHHIVCGDNEYCIHLLTFHSLQPAALWMVFLHF